VEANTDADLSCVRPRAQINADVTALYVTNGGTVDSKFKKG
jgi:hypothetical protein